jgi:hypothetical protein
MRVKKFHYDQKALYAILLDFMKGSEGMEITEEDAIQAFRAAKKRTGYFKENVG